MRAMPNDEIKDFLISLFKHMPQGYIEVRIIEDKKKGRVFDRRWYSTVDGLLADLPHIIKFAEDKKAGIFFGVLPRFSEGVGKSEDTLPGIAAWVDLDFRDYKGGEGECRKILEQFPLPPSVIVRTGHGLHAYWLFREPEEPTVLVNIAARLANALGGDNVADAARIMRLPGTMNLKEA